VAIPLVVFPVALVVVSCGVSHSTVAPLHSFLPISLVDRAIFVTKLAVTVTHSVKPRSFIFNTFLVVYIGAMSISKSINNLTFVSASVGPSVVTFASYFILAEFTLVHCAVSPFESTLAVKKAVSQFSFILMSILKDARALAMVNFANLKESIIDGFLTCPFFS